MPDLKSYLLAKKAQQEQDQKRQKVKDYLTLKFGTAPQPSSFDVGVTNSTATAPVPTDAPAADNFQMENLTPLDLGLQDPGETPDAMSPAPSAPTPPVAATPAPSPAADTATPDAPLPFSTSEKPDLYNAAAREKLANSKPSVGNIIAESLAGLGDAVNNSAGGNAHALSTIRADESNKKAQALQSFDLKDKEAKEADEKDPTSPISRSYQDLLAKYTGRNVADFKNISAQRAKQILPVTEKSYQAELSKKSIQNNKEIMLGLKDEQQQDKLEKEHRDRFDKSMNSRSGGMGREDAKVNAAIHARALIEGSRNPSTGEIELNQIQSPELALALANIVSGSNQSNLETFRAMQPQALSKDIKTKIGYLFGKPVDVLPQEWTNQLVHMLDRQGAAAEDLRNKYIDDFMKTAPSRLSKERLERLKSVSRGNSYRETFGIPADEGGLKNIAKNQPAVTGEVTRLTSDGKKAVFDSATKQFKRWAK